MPRRRILVAVIPPPEIIEICRVLRRMLGDRRPERITPHITVVPPVNIESARFTEMHRHLRRVTASTRPIELALEGFASFHPSTPTIHLQVAEPDGNRLADLKAALMQGDLERKDTHSFRPHITVRDRAEESQIRSVLAAFDTSWTSEEGDEANHRTVAGARFFDRWVVDRVHLMEQFRSESRGTHWVSISEEPLGPARVVGRGGVELVMRVSGTVEPAVVAMLEAESEQFDGCSGLVSVTAEVPDGVGEPVGVALGSVNETGAVLEHLFVGVDSRRMGVGRHLIAYWCHAAALAGAPTVVAHEADGSGILAATGFSRVGGLWVRELS